MTFRDVYILVESWDDELNRIQTRSPYFPGQGAGEHPHSLVITGIRDGWLKGRNVDSLTSAANVSKAEILAFIDRAYGDEETQRKLMPHLYERYQELLSFAKALPEEGYYYSIVADEF
jgi:hypothetical protein